MPARSGGRYTVTQGGTPKLIERTGYKPEAEAKPAQAKNLTSGKAKAKAADQQEQTDAE